jgi:molybdopterin/thiamine biosynthesis adenylyltransferase
MRTPEGKTAVVFGAGGLGAPAALTLASAGVGRIVLVDRAPVTSQDVAGSPLLRADDVGKLRGAAAAERLARRFPALALEAADAGDEALVRAADVVLDASNGFVTMFRANDTAVLARRPLVHAGVLRLTAQLLTVLPGETGCLRCLFEGPPPGPADAVDDAPGPLGGLAGALLASEALRVLAGGPGAYAGRLLVLDARSFRSRAVPVRLRASCAVCGARAAVAAGGAP